MPRLNLEAEAYLEGGEWHVILKAPRWMLVDMVERMGASRSLDHSNGPELRASQNKITQESSILLVTRKEPADEWEPITPHERLEGEE